MGCWNTKWESGIIDDEHRWFISDGLRNKGPISDIIYDPYSRADYSSIHKHQDKDGGAIQTQNQQRKILHSLWAGPCFSHSR